MGITYFNWSELLSNSRGDLAAIICLAYAQTSVYNELSSKTMMYRLNLHHVPQFIFNKRLFQQYKHVLVCNYKTTEPQSYFRNCSFLFTNASARYKVVYLRALSMRSLDNTDDYIPKAYYEKLTYNPFLTIKDDRIYFPLESREKLQPPQ